jgi:hypothetical protein
MRKGVKFRDLANDQAQRSSMVVSLQQRDVADRRLGSYGSMEKVTRNTKVLIP